MATELWNALRASFTLRTGEGLPALGRLERSASSPGGRVRIMLRNFLAHGPTFDEANWSMISEQLTVQMELLANQSLKLVGLESTPAAGAATATGDILKGSTKAPVPRAEAGGAGCRYGSGTCTACARCSLCRGVVHPP